jgi:hypothetical protein
MSEPQNGRIGGGVLKDNLLRQGVDLAFEKDQLYLKVPPEIESTVSGNEYDDGDPNFSSPGGRGTISKGIGINTDAPSDMLTVNTTMGTTNLEVSNANIANYSLLNSEIQVNSGNIFLNAANNIFLTSLATDDLKVDFNTIRTTTPNTNIELRPDGTGELNIRSNWNITGNLHATGNISTVGDFTFGTGIEDSVTFEADVNSDIIPDQNNTSTIGSPSKKWLNIYSNLLHGQRVEIGSIEVEGTSLSTRQGNIFYVSTLGDDTNVGDHQHGAFRTLKHALDVSDASTAGPVTIHVYPGIYEEELPLVVPPNVSIKGEDIRNVVVKPAAGYESEDVFYVEGQTTISDITIKDFFYDSINNKGYAFRFTPNGLVNDRSPYIKNVTVITQGSTTSASDPRGFTAGDAGKGAWIDGSELDSATLEGSMLFHAATFITPGVDAITMTNGVRVEWLNSFTYFADRSLYATQGVLGLGSNGVRYGAEIRSINSASIYGNYGAEADGADTLMYLIGHNFAYTGAGKNVQNDLSLTLQDQETVELNNGKIYYVSTDQEGTFRVGDSFFANFKDGTTSFEIGEVSLENVSAIYVNNNDNITYIDGEFIRTGNLIISGNTITTRDGDLVFSPDNEYLDLKDNPALIISRGTTLDANDFEADIRYNTDTNLFEGYSTGSLSFGGIYSSDRTTSIDAHNTNNTVVLRVNSIQVGTFNNTGINIHGLSTGDVLFDDNRVNTTLSNSDLELRRQSSDNVIIDDYLIKNKNFTNTSNNQLTLATTGRGYVKFDGNTGVTIPFGNTLQRETSPEVGHTRWNVDDEQLETYNGDEWQRSASDDEAAVTDVTLKELVDIYTLVLG